MDIIENNGQINDLIARIRNSNDNHLILGDAGSGKTEIIRKIMQNDKNAVCLAPTGLACYNITDVSKGIIAKTIHSFLGPDYFGQWIRKKLHLYSYIQRIIIDEISMVRSDMFQQIDERLRDATGIDKPFGGRQMILFGDFRQLPPVCPVAEVTNMIIREYGGIYAFSTDSWRSANFNIHMLKTNFRCSDNDYKDFLHELHEGRLDPGGCDRIPVGISGNEFMRSDTMSVGLCDRRENAKFINCSMIERLSGRSISLEGVVYDHFPEQDFPTYLHMVLKIGCKVMVVRNSTTSDTRKYYNGLIGAVIDYDEGNQILTVRTSMGDLRLHPETWRHWRYGLDEYGNITKTPGGAFQQYPVQPAYAITIHKSQGLTLDKTVIFLDDSPCFAQGQLYTALSRVRSFQDIRVNRKITMNDVRSSPDVDVFYKSLAMCFTAAEMTCRNITNPSRGVFAESLKSFFMQNSSNASIYEDEIFKM